MFRTFTYVLFISGTKIKFLGGSNYEWENVDIIAQKEQLSLKACIRGTSEMKR